MINSLKNERLAFGILLGIDYGENVIQISKDKYILIIKSKVIK